MNTNMTGFRWFSKNLCIFVLRTKVALALEGLKTCCFSLTLDRHFFAPIHSLPETTKETEGMISVVACVPLSIPHPTLPKTHKTPHWMYTSFFDHKNSIKYVMRIFVTRNDSLHFGDLAMKFCLCGLGVCNSFFFWFLVARDLIGCCVCI